MPKKIILISGGSDGLGKALAAKLSPNHQIIILSHNEEKLKQVSSELSCGFVSADVTDYSSLDKAVKTIIEKYQKIDVLINCAGIWMQGNLEDCDPEQMGNVIKVNTLGTIFLSKAVLPTMISQKGGRIINIVSQDGLLSKKERSVYAASKWGITGFTKCLQADLSAKNIAVTGIYPGLMKTALFEKQGVTRDVSHALGPENVANLVEYVINLPLDTLLPEIGIKNINNSNNMDDTSAPQNGLDINPDMMTTSTGTPATPPTTTTMISTTTTTPPIPQGVIDITPGAKEEVHPPKTVDITPSVSTTTVTTPGIDLPVNQGVIDITPDKVTVPVTEEIPSEPHLSDLVPQPTPTVTTTTTTETPSATVTPVVTTPASPLAEDPDLVKLA